MYVRFVPVNGADFKHAKIQLDPNETVSNIREKLAKHFNIENFKVLYHGRLVSDLTQTGIFYKMNANSTLHIIESAASNISRYDFERNISIYIRNGLLKNDSLNFELLETVPT